MSDAEFVKKYGPWALVTGASGGIGQEIAVDLAEKGLNLILVARSAEKLQSLAKSLTEKHGIDVQAIAADLGVEEDVLRLIAALSETEVGLYVANAGFGSVGAFADSKIDNELNMIDVNCRALTQLAYPLVRSMRVRGNGGMIFLSSIVAFQGVAQSANYAATKAYVQSFAEGLQVELAPSGINVLSAAPGPVGTGFAGRAGMNMGSAARPDTVAKATIAALGRARTTRPGFQAKLLGYGLGILPRRVRTLILTNVMKGMT
ncbi:SDR family NAD(P)-dependent oxidoreductase [Cognatiyoonia sp. IB215446]|uniref:SDR family NAD(P)-dependent oxidoreductase n=1 Tax=Cognatiyoonia sp. IB215446 TaxID=3097355 RepID=UPI002A0D43D6|nr:SDR family NAD(P)-dependent oxidoreductase [Cognatiyoonia sp. IB215446]MDX8349577.1 SDR family NAD(P)-dependent oxidoreductase [Cognatiyoonia sp. IB215446]